MQKVLPSLFAFLYNQRVENVTVITTNWDDNRKKHECESSVETPIFIQSFTSCKKKENSDTTAVQDCGLKAVWKTEEPQLSSWKGEAMAVSFAVLHGDIYD